MHVEKPSATSAAITAFCATKLEGPGGFLWIDGNGKITAGNGTLDDPKPNAFSLVQIADCPGSTETCRASCYVHGLEKHAPETHALYVHNSGMIRWILDGPQCISWASVMALWIAENCKGGFRWHVSGDVFSADYARFIVLVCQASPLVRHWIYTRSFDHVDVLVRARGNLAINLSADRDNYPVARETADRYGLRLCYLETPGSRPPVLVMDENDVIFPDYSLRGGTPEGQAWFADLPSHYKAMVCPVDWHGKSEKRRCGPCSRCLV